MHRIRAAFATRRRRLVAAVSALVLVGGATGVVVAVTRDDGPVLVLRSGGWQAAGGDDNSFEVGALCVRGGRSVDLVAVEPIRAVAGGEVTAFNVVQWPDDEDVHEPPDGRLALDDAPRVTRVDEPCSDDWIESQLAVEVHRVGNRESGVEGFRLWYRADGELRSVESHDGGAAFVRGYRDQDGDA